MQQEIPHLLRIGGCNFRGVGREIAGVPCCQSIRGAHGLPSLGFSHNAVDVSLLEESQVEGIIITAKGHQVRVKTVALGYRVTMEAEAGGPGRGVLSIEV